MQTASSTKVGAARQTLRAHERDYAQTGFGQEHLLQLSYLELEQKNLEVKEKRIGGASNDEMRDEYMGYLKKEAGIKSIVLFFCDLEGRLHALDYDKNFLLGSEDNLTFDGSSIRGFTAQFESDLRLRVDWRSFRWAPSDLFGPGKVLVFADVMDKDATFYDGDFRGKLSHYCEELRTKRGLVVNIAPEIEGFLFKGDKSEQHYDEKAGFELVTMSGYFNSLPQDSLRLFIDKLAEVKRALGFQNEKDHPEVAPAQFELNFRYSVALDTADQVQLYKLIARQVASTMGLTACFLPKPIADINGNGMHTNISLAKDGVNLFYDAKGQYSLSETAYRFLTGILFHAQDLCLAINSSVNSYRRLDPAFEAPNEIKVSSTDRGSMIRIPIGNEKSARIEVRTVAPDANPYLAFYTLLRAGMKGIDATKEEFELMRSAISGRIKKLPGEIYTALRNFNRSGFMTEIMGEANHQKYATLKKTTADRSPRSLGRRVKGGEVRYHHEITNQLIWGEF
ncbi:glutamine synthetase [Candidatus Peregrinibacteria bacterium CG_4_9_14_0_2_um_filter_53_11]|nr:MAG: glutamine synthetase [Candidatus Peregrinibacteria bacterium CG_4_9_14_0_2_um_filter_53_11]